MIQPPSRRRHLVQSGLGALAVLVALIAWAVASPLGATPDEEYHLSSIWCGQGQTAETCERGEEPGTRVVPEPLLAAPCFAFDAETSASCQADSFYVDDPRMVETTRGNFVGDYPPVFYFVMNTFVGPDATASVMAMRVVNALLTVLLVGGVALASPPGLRRALLVGTAVTAVPLGVFLLPSVNPSSWALISGATFLVSVVGYVTAQDRRRRLTLGALAALSLLVGAGARADSAIYAVLAVAAALLLALPRGREHLRRAIYPCVLAVVAAVAYFSSGQSGAASAEVAEHSAGRLLRVLIEVPQLWTGVFGTWGLGWLDTTMPAAVWVGSFGIFVATLTLGTHHLGLRRGLAFGIVAAAVWLVPAYIQYVSGTPVGSNVQPRYILPLIAMLAVTATLRVEGDAFGLTPAQRWFGVVVLSLANSTALWVNLRRYVTGLDVGSPNLDAGIEWWWDGPLSPMGVWVLGSVAFGAGLALLSRSLTVPALALATPPQDGAAPQAVTDGATEPPSASPEAGEPTESAAVADQRA